MQKQNSLVQLYIQLPSPPRSTSLFQPEEGKEDCIGLDGQRTVTACSKTLVHWDTNSVHLGHMGCKSRPDQEKPGFGSLVPDACQDSVVFFRER